MTIRKTKLRLLAAFGAGVLAATAMAVDSPRAETAAKGNEELGPFDYGATEIARYVSAEDDAMPTGISVKGVLKMKGEGAVALMEVKGQQQPFFIAEGDVIRLDGPTAKGKDRDSYIEVQTIRNHQVEIIQRRRPDQVIVIRN